MESILRSDIFFFITSIAVIIISVALLIALYYFIRILINFHKISTILKNYAENTETELKDIGHHVRQSPLFTFFFGKEKTKREPERKSKKTI
jgi:hypothetical protein